MRPYGRLVISNGTQPAKKVQAKTASRKCELPRVIGLCHKIYHIVYIKSIAHIQLIHIQQRQQFKIRATQAIRTWCTVLRTREAFESVLFYSVMSQECSGSSRSTTLDGSNATLFSLFQLRETNKKEVIYQPLPRMGD